MWNIKLLFITICALLIFSGCQNEEKPMNTLRLNFQEGDLPSLHPHALMIYLRGISISKSLFECLTRIDSNGKPVLAGAESVEVSPDKLRYTFKLRENHWSDGSPVTAQQYENAWKEALSPTSATSRADLLYMIKNAKEVKSGEMDPDQLGIKTVNNKTLTVELAYPSPYFLELVAQPICAPLVDPKKKEPAQFNGPFQVDTWKHGDLLSLKPNPHFWNKQNISLDGIDVYMIQDTMSAFALFEKGKLDWIGVPLTPLSAELIEQLKTSGQLESHPVDRAFWMFVNTTIPALSSPKIRQALSLAIDRKAITEHILVGGKPLEKPIPTALLPVEGGLKLEENLAEAKARFNEGLTDLHLTKEQYPPIVITYSQQAGRKQLAEYLQQVWSKAFEVKVVAEPQEWNVLRSNLEKGLFEISGAFEAAFYNDPLELMEKFTSIGPNNMPKWVDEDYKAIVAEAKLVADQMKRMQLLGQAENILVEQMPFVPICSDKFMFAHNKLLKGYAFDYVGACDFSYAKIE